jgi:hypothetical protein
VQCFRLIAIQAAAEPASGDVSGQVTKCQWPWGWGPETEWGRVSAALRADSPTETS